MSGGAIPPGQRWLDRLPIFDPQNPIEGKGVLVAEVKGQTNLIIGMTEALGLIDYGSEYGTYPALADHWRFNVEDNNFETVEQPDPPITLEDLVEATGIEGVTGSREAITVIPSRNEILFKIVPGSY